MDLYAVGRGVRYEGLSVNEARWAELRHEVFGDIATWAKRELSAADRAVPDWL
jgi:hypothetical protein